MGGTGPGNYSRVQYAIDNASAGDTIYVFDESSPYYENVDINKTVNIIGENKETTVIDGLSRFYVLWITRNDVTISDLTIQYGGGGWSTGGIYIAATDVTIENCIIQYNANGIFIEGASYNHVVNNTIHHNIYHSIRMEYTSNNHVCDNSIIGNDNGIYMWESSDNIIVRNTLEFSNWAGMILGEYCDGNLIYHNNFVNNVIEHAYDLSNNSWDAGYPIGGNYWDDYTGVDTNGDGIGDTPYVIRGPNAVDQYPLMEPYGGGLPNVSIDIQGGLGVSIILTDNRENATVDLPVSIDIAFSYLIRDRLFGGSPIAHIDLMLSDNKEITVRQLPPYLIGMGTVEVDVTVGLLEESAKLRVISFLVL